MRQYQPRNQNKEIISRWDLFMALGAKYQHLGSNPFVFKKDGKVYYNILKDFVEFTCCPNTEHKFRMTPLQMMKMVKKYPEIPCPYCAATGASGGPEKGGIYGETGDEGVFMFKRYLGDRNDMSNLAAVDDAIKRAAEDQKKEQEKAEYDSLGGIEGVGQASSLEDYMRRHPEYKPREVVGKGAEKINNKFNKFMKNRYGEHDGPPGEDSELEREMNKDIFEDQLATPSDESQLSSEDAALLTEMTSGGANLMTQLQESQSRNPNQNLKNILSDTENENNITTENSNDNKGNNDDEEEEISYNEIKKSV